VWNFAGLVPDPSNRLRLVAVALALTGAAACGPGGGAPATYLIAFTLGDSPADLEKLSYRVAYTGGDFIGNGIGVSCTLLNTDSGETADFSDNDNGLLTVSIDATDNALSPPEEIVTCDFTSKTQPIANDFTITVLSATDDFGDPVAPGDVSVSVTSTDVASSASGSTGSAE
jgi:hypothetical protein